MPEGMARVLIRALIVWVVIMAAESIHGIARRLFLEPRIGDLRARQISVLIGSIIIIAITLVFVRWLTAASAFGLILVGTIWVALTVGFEVVLGRLAMGLSWERIASDYNFFQGGFMLLGLLVMLLAPVSAAKLVKEI